MGMIFSGVGELQSGRGGAQALTYRAQVARNNAAIAERNAQYATQKGQAKEGVVRENTAQTIGEQRAAMAGNNVDAGSGSALRLQTDAAAVGETEAQTVRNNAAQEAYSWRLKEYSQNMEADTDLWQAEMSRKAAIIGAYSAGVGGASGYASRWDNWGNKGSTTGAASAGGSSEGGSKSGGFSDDELFAG